MATPAPRAELPLGFACVAAALLIAPPLVFTAGVAAEAQTALALQHMLALSAFLVIHATTPNALARHGAVVTLFLYIAATLLDLTSLAVFSVRLDGVVRVLALGSDPIGVLRQANITLWNVTACALGAAGLLALFLALYRRLPRIDLGPGAVAALLASPLLLAGGLVSEQMAASGSEGYLRRSALLPGYYRLFAPTSQSLTLALPTLPSDDEIDEALTRVRGAANPKNVLFIVLESVRHDVVNAHLTPALDALAKRSLTFTRAFTEAPSTPRAWNVLLMNRSIFTAHQESLGLEGKQSPGAFPLRVLKRAGYRIFFSNPTDLEWLGFRKRILGSGGLVDSFHSTYPGHDDDRHLADGLAAGKVAEWLEAKDTPQPFFILIQLDSSHYTYYFDESRAVVRPYAGAANPYLVASQSEMDLVFNRYQNAVHEVDHNIGRMLEALRRGGHEDDTAVVVVSDHGQSFRLGAAAHMSINDATKRIPMILRMPGIQPAVIDDYVSHRNVVPTLFEYLDIQGLDDRILLGESVLSRSQRPRTTLTFRGDITEAHLTFPLFSVVFDVVRLRDISLTFTPTTLLDRNEQPIDDWPSLLARVPWKEELRFHLHGTEGAAELRGEID